MKVLETSLLREKFVIRDPGQRDGKSRVVATSNRLVIDLRDDSGRPVETFVVRAQNMHGCVRMAAQLLQAYLSIGPLLLSRAVPFSWKDAWDKAQSDYETAFNPQRWVVVYHDGAPIFSEGSYHSFLDTIEKCQMTNKGLYEETVALAEAVLRQSGKYIKIDYDGNVALNLNLEEKQGRIGVIVRGPDKTMTFSFLVTAKAVKRLNFPQCMGVAAAFLEGIQMAFMVAMNNEKMNLGKIKSDSTEARQTREAVLRLPRLNAEIASLEGSFDVRYRPERPEF